MRTISPVLALLSNPPDGGCCYVTSIVALQMVQAVTSPVDLARTPKKTLQRWRRKCYVNMQIEGNSTLGGAASRRGHLNTFFASLFHYIGPLAEIVRGAHVRAPLLAHNGPQPIARVVAGHRCLRMGAARAVPRKRAVLRKRNGGGRRGGRVREDLRY